MAERYAIDAAGPATATELLAIVILGVALSVSIPALMHYARKASALT